MNHFHFIQEAIVVDDIAKALAYTCLDEDNEKSKGD